MERKSIWWLPLLRRMFVWGTAMSWLLGFLPLAVIATVLFSIDFGFPMDDPALEVVLSPWEDLLQSFQAGVLLTWPLWGLGLIMGLVSGFCAPSREPENPLKSRFFGTVVVQTLLWWIVFLAAVALSVFLIGQFLRPLVNRFYASINFEIPWVPLMILVCVFSFIVCLWRAINRALHPSKGARP